MSRWTDQTVPPRFLPTNGQCACLGLAPVDSDCEWVQLKSVAKDPDFETWACFDGDTIRKYVHCSSSHYEERTYQEATGKNRTLLLPRTHRVKPKTLSKSPCLTESPWGCACAGPSGPPP